MLGFVRLKVISRVLALILLSCGGFSSDPAYGKVFFTNADEADLLRTHRTPQQGAAFALAFQAEELLLQRGEVHDAIDLCRQAIGLDPETQGTIGQMLNTYSHRYFTGDEDHPRNITQAFDLCVESARLRCLDSGTYLGMYVRAVLCGSDGFEQDVPKALGFYGQAVTVGVDQLFITKMRDEFRLHIQSLISVRNSYREAIDLLRALHGIEPDNEPHKQNLAHLLFVFATAEFSGNCDVPQNVDEAIDFCREAARLGNEDAQSRLGDFSDHLYLGKTAGIVADKGRAISLLREALSYNSTAGGKRNLGIMLKEHAIALFRESDNELSKMEAAIALMQESAELGNAHATNILPQLRALTRSSGT